tara:strand:+ start:153 stop:1049 length:897 start_codon:yes stop_codon:yes gene_type:complete
MEDAIKAMRSAFIHLSRGDMAVPKRLSLSIPDKNAIALIMPAYAFNSPYYIVKTVSINYANPQKDLPLIHAAVQVFDASKGNLIVTMDGESITAIRTGAASGLATDLLANKETKVLAVFGTGVQARTQVEAVLAVRIIKKVLVFSRTAKNAKSFCSWISELFGIEAEEGRLNCLNKADIICTATTSVNSLFDHSDIKLGVHINAVGSFKPQVRELPAKTVQIAKVVVDQKDACELEAGDLIIPVKEGHWSFEKLYGELGQIADGEIPGREFTDEITLFKSVGNAIQDHALATLILEKL